MAFNVIKTKQDIVSLLEQNGSRLKALGVRKIRLFGSFVRGEQQPDNDIDLLVESSLDKRHLTPLWNCPFFWRRSCSTEDSG